MVVCSIVTRDMYSCLVISLLVADGKDLFEGFLEKMGIPDVYKFISLLCFDTEKLSNPIIALTVSDLTDVLCLHWT